MLLFLAFAVLLLNGMDRTSATCNSVCHPFVGTIQDKRCSQTYLFTAKVLRPVIPSSNPATTREYLVEVIHIYHGPHDMLPGSVVTIATPRALSACGVLPNIGMKYLLGSNTFIAKTVNAQGQESASKGRNSIVGTIKIRLVCDTFERLTQRVRTFLQRGACQVAIEAV